MSALPTGCSVTGTDCSHHDTPHHNLDYNIRKGSAQNSKRRRFQKEPKHLSSQLNYFNADYMQSMFPLLVIYEDVSAEAAVVLKKKSVKSVSHSCFYLDGGSSVQTD